MSAGRGPGPAGDRGPGQAGTGPEGPSAADRWRDWLAAWAIPEEILRRAPESPHHYPVSVFASRADAAVRRLTFSNRRALEALRPGGSVLDVGCGTGAASLPLARRAGRLVGVDRSPEMLSAFAERARAAGVAVETVEGSWPEVAGRTPAADVVVCHHVVYNVPDLPAFALRLTDHARRRVVVEMTVAHPLSPMNELWRRFHGLSRPDRPTTEDAVAVLREAGIRPRRHDWTAPRPGGFPTRAELVAFIRRALCLGPERDPEVEEAVAHRIVERDGGFGLPDRPVSTLWWEGSAG